MTIDMGIIPIVFHVIQKCRDARIRMNAIEFLEAHPRLEALWDGPLVAKIGRLIDRVERMGSSLEHAAAGGVEARIVPSWARVSRIRLEFSAMKSSVMVTCMRGQDKNLVCYKESITW